MSTEKKLQDFTFKVQMAKMIFSGLSSPDVPNLPFNISYRLGRIRDKIRSELIPISEKERELFLKYSTKSVETDTPEIKPNTPEHSKYLEDYRVIQDDIISVSVPVFHISDFEKLEKDFPLDFMESLQNFILDDYR